MSRRAAPLGILRLPLKATAGVRFFTGAADSPHRPCPGCGWHRRRLAQLVRPVLGGSRNGHTGTAPQVRCRPSRGQRPESQVIALQAGSGVSRGTNCSPPANSK